MRRGLPLMVTAMAFVAAASLSGAPQSQPPAGPAPVAASPDVPSLQSYLDSVAKAKASAQQAWEALRASVQAAGSASEKGYASEWLESATPNGAAASPFYAGTEALLKSWIDALASGADSNPPSDEIRAAMEKWQEAHANILDALQQCAALEKTRRANAARLGKLKPETDDWLYYKDQQQQTELTQRKLLSDAGSALAATAAFSGPISDADRTPSPFSGPPTPGAPDRLFVHLRRASALIGESIPVQIGFFNGRGVNAFADRSLTLSLSCEGCTTPKKQVTIHKDERFAQTEITITGAAARFFVNSPEMRSSVMARAYGCYRAPSVALAAEQDLSTGAADGVTPIRFRFAFHDATGQRATDGRSKSISAKLTGVGQRISMAQSVAALKSKDGSIVVPANECVAEEGVVSALVGSTKVSADYNSNVVGPLEFRFLYAFPLLDKICIALGVIFGFIANYSILRRREIHWVASLASSAIGAGIVFAAGYATVLGSTTVQDTWLIALGLATIGGVLGVSAAKLVLGRLVPSSDEGPSPTEESFQG